MTKVTDREFNAALPVMQKLLWADSESRKRIQEHGLNIIPANFYSNTPSISEILDSYEYNESEPPYLNCGIFDHERLREELSELVSYSSGFAPAVAGDEETCTSYFWKNSQFSYSDAMAYYAYIRRVQPKKVIEIGSGFSSLIAIEALKENGFGELICIEPFPRPFISALNDDGKIDLKMLRAQDVTAEMLNAMIGDGDILFIDSTHTVKTGSDCLQIYLRLIPRIVRNILVHVHDVFLPFGLPKSWLVDKQIYWTEQYLLLALLIDNPRAKLLFGSAYHKHFNEDLLREFMHNKAEGGGGSFWFEYDGRTQS